MPPTPAKTPTLTATPIYYTFVTGLAGYHNVGQRLDVCWQVGPAGYPYTITIEQVAPAGSSFFKAFSFASGGTTECFEGYLEASDVPGVRFRLTVVINGITLEPGYAPPADQPAWWVSH